MLVSVNFKLIPISSGVRIWSNLYTLDSTSFLLICINVVFFSDFHWDMSQNWINMYKYYINYPWILIDIGKTFKNRPFRNLFRQKQLQYGSCTKSSSIYFSGNKKRRSLSFQGLFILSTYQFWLSCELFFVLLYFAAKWAISGWNSCVYRPIKAFF